MVEIVKSRHIDSVRAGAFASHRGVGFRKFLDFRVFLTLLILASLLPAAQGRAAAFTLLDPILITGGETGNVNGVLGVISPAGVPSSLGDPIGLSGGDISFLTNDVIVVLMTLSGGSAAVDGLGIGAASNPMIPNPVGVGTFDDAGLQAPGSVSVGPFTTLRGDFDFSSDNLTAGETTVRLFVTYGPAGSALAIGNAVNFSISSGTDFTVQGTLIPEPSTALLIGLGTILVTLRRNRKSRNGEPPHPQPDTFPAQSE